MKADLCRAMISGLDTNEGEEKMKCPNCWSRKIDAGNANILHRIVAAFFLMSPVKCRHCFHCFNKAIWTSLPTPESSPVTSADEDNYDHSNILMFPQSAETSSTPQRESSSSPIRKAA